MTLRSFHRTLVAASLAVIGSGAAFAADANAQSAYERERAACMDGRSQQSQADCLKEARNSPRGEIL